MIANDMEQWCSKLTQELEHLFAWMKAIVPSSKVATLHDPWHIGFIWAERARRILRYNVLDRNLTEHEKWLLVYFDENQ